MLTTLYPRKPIERMIYLTRALLVSGVAGESIQPHTSDSKFLVSSRMAFAMIRSTKGASLPKLKNLIKIMHPFCLRTASLITEPAQIKSRYLSLNNIDVPSLRLGQLETALICEVRKSYKIKTIFSRLNCIYNTREERTLFYEYTTPKKSNRESVNTDFTIIWRMKCV